MIIIRGIIIGGIFAGILLLIAFFDLHIELTLRDDLRNQPPSFLNILKIIFFDNWLTAFWQGFFGGWAKYIKKSKESSCPKT
jgi:hypothetical protein